MASSTAPAAGPRGCCSRAHASAEQRPELTHDRPELGDRRRLVKLVQIPGSRQLDGLVLPVRDRGVERLDAGLDDLRVLAERLGQGLGLGLGVGGELGRGEHVGARLAQPRQALDLGPTARARQVGDAAIEHALADEVGLVKHVDLPLEASDLAVALLFSMVADRPGLDLGPPGLAQGLV